jgi:hypothetical protein
MGYDGLRSLKKALVCMCFARWASTRSPTSNWATAGLMPIPDISNVSRLQSLRTNPGSMVVGRVDWAGQDGRDAIVPLEQWRTASHRSATQSQRKHALDYHDDPVSLFSRTQRATAARHSPVSLPYVPAKHAVHAEDPAESPPHSNSQEDPVSTPQRDTLPTRRARHTVRSCPSSRRDSRLGRHNLGANSIRVLSPPCHLPSISRGTAFPPVQRARWAVSRSRRAFTPPLLLGTAFRPGGLCLIRDRYPYFLQPHTSPLSP